MPLYDYKCQDCGTVREVVKKLKDFDREEICEECSLPMRRLIIPPKLRLFRKGIYEDITTEPLYIDSMKQLKAECKKHGVTSAYAEDIC